MSNPTYTAGVKFADKPLVWLHGAVKSPPFSATARLEAGFLLRRLQRRRQAGAAAFQTHAGYWSRLSRT